MNLSNTKCDKLSFYEEKIRWRMRRQISNAEAIFYENQEEHIQRFLGRYTCRKPVLVYWESEQRWTSVNGLEVMSMFDEYCHHIYLDDINKKIQAELPEDKTLGFKRQLQFFILGDEKIRIWVPQGELYFALMNVLQMFPLKKMVDDWTRYFQITVMSIDYTWYVNRLAPFLQKVNVSSIESSLIYEGVLTWMNVL